MKRQVSIFIETAPAQLDSEFTCLELFNDEKISVSSTIQNISDISKIFTDFSQGFTIPCSPTNNAVFQHFYQNDVDATMSYQFRFNAFIEIDTTLFRRGKIQLEKTNLKNGKPDSYSLTFYGAGVSLKDHFLEDKLNQLDYSTLDHDYINQEVYDRVTIDSSVTDYNVRYPLITSKRVWQFNASVPLPTANVPDWYNYPTNNENNLGHANGRIFFYELFPAVRVATIFNLIEQQYNVTFNGIFLLTDLFKKAFLYFKSKNQFANFPVVDLDFLNRSGTLLNAFNTTTNSVTPIDVETTSEVSHALMFTITNLTPSPIDYVIDIYKNDVFFANIGGSTAASIQNFPVDIDNEGVYTVKIRNWDINITPFTIDITIEYSRAYYNTNTSSMVIETGQVTSTALTINKTNIQSVAPDMKIIDLIAGICKEFNLTVYSKEKNVYTFDTIPFWYSKGAVIDISKFTDVTSIEIERVKLYKSIEFKYQDSESFMNKAFLESPLNPNAHQYGNLKIGYDFDGGEYKIDSPFENLLHCNFGNNLQVGYCLNKEFSPYVPKPVLLYMNTLTTLTAGDKIHWDGLANIGDYVPFGQDAQVLTANGLISVSLNFGAEISSLTNTTNFNSLYLLYYSTYLTNLYLQKNRLTKVKTILPISLLTTLQLNDRLIIRGKRYFINEMQSDLTTGDVSFTLLNDFAPVKPIKFETTPVGNNNVLQFMIGLTNGVGEIGVTKSANAGNVTLSETKFEEDGLLNVTVPANAARTITITLTSAFTNGNTSLNYIIINQV